MVFFAFMKAGVSKWSQGLGSCSRRTFEATVGVCVTLAAMLVRDGVVFAAMHVSCASCCKEHLDPHHRQYRYHSYKTGHGRIAFVPK